MDMDLARIRIAEADWVASPGIATDWITSPGVAADWIASPGVALTGSHCQVTKWLDHITRCSDWLYHISRCSEWLDHIDRIRRILRNLCKGASVVISQLQRGPGWVISHKFLQSPLKRRSPPAGKWQYVLRWKLQLYSHHSFPRVHWVLSWIKVIQHIIHLKLTIFKQIIFVKNNCHCDWCYYNFLHFFVTYVYFSSHFRYQLIFFCTLHISILHIVTLFA